MDNDELQGSDGDLASVLCVRVPGGIEGKRMQSRLVSLLPWPTFHQNRSLELTTACTARKEDGLRGARDNMRLFCLLF
jgi:hypothetical protein